MLDQAKVIVANTTPLIALTAARGSLDVLHVLYSRGIAPYEVAEEIGRMRERGIWLSNAVIGFALAH